MSASSLQKLLLLEARSFHQGLKSQEEDEKSDKNRPKSQAYCLGMLPCVSHCLPKSLYPKVDLSIWLRSCLYEHTEPLYPSLQRGRIPHWLRGSLLQNGPGKFFFGNQVLNHLFDGSALIQAFRVERNRVCYQSKFLRTSAFKRNLAAHKTIVPEFGTKGDNQSGNAIERLFKMLRNNHLDQLVSDNTFISVYPFNNDYLCFYESPFATRLNVDDLNTKGRLNLNKSLKLVNTASHPHYDDHGNVLLLGLRLDKLYRPNYVVLKIPAKLAEIDCKDNELEQFLENKARIVASVKASNRLKPSYMHSFGLTSHHVILIEQPMVVDLAKVITGTARRQPLMKCMQWRPQLGLRFRVINRFSGEENTIEYRAEKPFFFLHVINAFEDKNQIILDISAYSDASMLHCMDTEALQTAQFDPNYASCFRGRPKRFVLPLTLNKRAPKPKVGDIRLKLRPRHGKKSKNSSKSSNFDYNNANFNSLSYAPKAKIVQISKQTVMLSPHQLCDVGIETPTLNYLMSNARKYRYFYGITSDVDDEQSAGKIVKVDTLDNVHKVWFEEDAYCSEPIFVARKKNSKSGKMAREDEGVLVTSLVRSVPRVNSTALVVLDATNLGELFRAEFVTNGPVPKPLHGFFTANNNTLGPHKEF